MNVLTNSIIIFFFLLFTFTFNFTTESDNLIKNKIYLYILSCIFQLLTIAIYKIKKNCKTNLKNLINNSLITGTFVVIGYSIYVDLFNIEETRNYLLPYTNNKFIHSVLISTIIFLFVLSAKTVEMIIVDNNTTKCIKE